MGQISVIISRNPGSAFSANQHSAFYYMREHADSETKQPFINLVRQFIQKVVIGKTPGHQPASLEVHGRIASILAAMDAATILEKQFEALKRIPPAWTALRVFGDTVILRS
ncbi:hypothetical protein [Agrobacterium salinitolerans]|uniref:hypothetical protein n=1 Tax=Agrobacterium salinitolerans TaxID=1183413 RepID=UPI0020B426BA|nr:hypothetical protein [Agrobacterium salinitolerans]